MMHSLHSTVVSGASDSMFYAVSSRHGPPCCSGVVQHRQCNGVDPRLESQLEWDSSDVARDDAECRRRV